MDNLKRIDPDLARALHLSIYADFKGEDYMTFWHTVNYTWCVSMRGFMALQGHYTKMEH